ncbi:DUF6020 family protein [Bifidobacterium sp. ESL0745]|uniref:DUF6020 family protein n=1 Tax=Bifidobacterium sp. ESL0745 TaxID=2983226 RepID=UPI0023F6AE8D|nr:DUF6020 family protein [Bifidobacterium sp. ESL0745]MDF7666203.1 DUF6020 family protein [Bifidobacterium sp. ESL0745]
MNNPSPSRHSRRQPSDSEADVQGLENRDGSDKHASVNPADNVSASVDEIKADTPMIAHSGRFSTFLCWALAVAASLWIALCTSLGPLYRQYETNPGIATITAFSFNNAMIFAITFAICMLVIIELVRFGRGQLLIPYDFGLRARFAAVRNNRRHQTHESTAAPKNGDNNEIDTSSNTASNSQTGGKRGTKFDNAHWLRSRIWQWTRRMASSLRSGARRCMMTVTDKWWKIALVLIIGWLWVPITLVAAFGADIRSQFREFSWAWNQWTGLKQPYIGFFSFVPMDIYPTAHYLWPAKPTYLTDQHNIVLTLIYGGAGTVSRYFTGSNDLGIAVLASGQLLFAAFCLAATANRFFNHPWLKPRHRLFAHVSAMSSENTSTNKKTELTPKKIDTATFVGPLPRFFILLFFLICPLVLFSTISLTKSPLFAFAFVWWFGVGYEILCTKKMRRNSTHGQSATSLHRISDNSDDSEHSNNVDGAMIHYKNGPNANLEANSAYDRVILHLRKRTFIALVLSTLVMMISVKYALYIVLFEFAIALFADRRRWKTYIIGMLLPALLFEGAVGLATRDGAIINGDPIESHGVQLQQIARVAVLNPDGIPQDAKNKLAPIFNLDQMAEAYSQQDADPVKSSGIQTKRVSYRWRTVSKADMKNFNAAWLEIVKANPRICLDALLAKSYGYFDILDPPYIDMTYYVAYAGTANFTDWIGYWCAGWRRQLTDWLKNWSSKPAIGWLIHGNTFVIITLLLGAAEVILRRWKTLSTHLPLLLLMGVMITAPANNFERHMLPLVFVLGFVLLTFWQDSRAQRAKARTLRNGVTTNHPQVAESHESTDTTNKLDTTCPAKAKTAGLEL